MGFKTFTDGSVLSAADVNNYLMKQAVIVCTSGTRPASPTEGMEIYETDTNRGLAYDGAAWKVIFTLGYPTSWAGLTLSSGYQAFTGYAPAARFVREGTVELRGGVKKTSGSFATNTQFASLPNSTYYPASLCTFVCPAERIANAGWSIRIEIGTDGSIKSFLADPGGTSYGPTWTEFNGSVQFDTT